MKTFIITQNPDDERFTNLTTALNGLGVTWETWPGVDASLALNEDGTINEGHIYAILFQGRRPATSVGQAGCTIAHLELWRHVLELDEPVLVLEDDAMPTDTFDVAAIEACGLDMAFLHSPHLPLRYSKDDPDGFYRVGARGGVVGTVAYYLTPAGARYLLNGLRKDIGSIPDADTIPEVAEYVDPQLGILSAHLPVDAYVSFHTRYMPNVGGVVPTMIHHTGLVSTIADPTWWVPPIPVEPPTFDQRKERALVSHAKTHESVRKAGIEITGILPEPIRLASAVPDRDAFVAMLALLREGEDLTLQTQGEVARDAFLAQPQAIADVDGNLVPLPGVMALRAVLLQYGVKWSALWTGYKQREAAIKAATTEEELDAALALP